MKISLGYRQTAGRTRGIPGRDPVHVSSLSRVDATNEWRVIVTTTSTDFQIKYKNQAAVIL